MLQSREKNPNLLLEAPPGAVRTFFSVSDSYDVSIGSILAMTIKSENGYHTYHQTWQQYHFKYIEIFLIGKNKPFYHWHSCRKV
jgi:hypothetical protein